MTAAGRGLRSVPLLTGYAALVLIAVLGWWFLAAGEAAMVSMSGDGPIMDLMWRMMRPSSVAPYLLASALMWVVMMIAMMVPAVLPMAAMYRRMDRGNNADLDTLVFACGYLAAWSGFALLAAGLQWWLHERDLLHGMLLKSGPQLAAAILLTAGLYQLTPLKDACLARCRGPMSFFLANWRAGRLGAFRMGLDHGLYCIGCCWALMLLMFVGGAMSVLTMAALSVFILAERLLPPGPWVSKLPGLAMLAWGGWVLLAG